ncbi:MAG: cobalamin-dependent protein, partial [Victivallales bacterium]
MRILLLSTNTFSEPYSVYPLGMSVIAGALTAAGHEVRQFDPMVCGKDKCHEQLTGLLQEFPPGAIGVSVRNLDNMDSSDESAPLIHDSIEIVRHLRTLSRAPIVIGGSGFSLQPETILRLTGADYGIVGEGEDAAVDLFSKLSAGKKIAEKL